MHVTSSRELEARGASKLSHGLIHQVFSARAGEFPDRVAIRAGNVQLTYSELEARANQLAHRLRKLGVGPESLVGLYLDRSAEMIIAILAVLKAGGGYLPIDLAYPAERIRFMVEDAKPVLVLTEQRLAEKLPRGGNVLCLDVEAERLAAEPRTAPAGLAMTANVAYVIYTSGSTGRPKGVLVTHANVVRLFRATEQWYQFSEDDTWTLFHSFAFDFSVWELWGALLYGGKLVLVPYLVSRSPEAFHELLVRERVTVLNQTPSAFRQLIAADAAAGDSAMLTLRWIIFGGEALDLQSLKPWFDRHGDQTPCLVNMYGITETTVHVTYRPIRHQDLLDRRGSVIGQPIPDLTLHILDERQQPCPAGVPGEMYIGGAGVARGYLARPELTRARFIPDPFAVDPGMRLYRSGDLARRLPDGDVEYLGRLDQQVKIRGFRIELGEIEAALNSHAVVRQAAVVVHEGAKNDKRLIAYVVTDAARPAVDELREFVSTRLPEYMIPAGFVFLDNLPLNINGKIDRAALPAPESVRPELSSPFVPPRTADEKLLAGIWQCVLQVDKVGVHDNFFALGGDSIRSIQVLAQAQEQGIEISLANLFEAPTIAELVQVRGSRNEDTIRGVREPFAALAKADVAKLRGDLADAYPMARLQLGMLYHTQRDPGSAIFHDVFSFRFRLPFQETLLRTAVQRLSGRHAIYRTSFDVGTYSEPLQLIHKTVTVPFTVEDLRTQSVEEQKQALVAWVEAEKRRPFDWTRPPMMRLHAQRYTDATFQLIVSFHHIIMDGWSLAAMLTELFQDYSGLMAGKQLDIGSPPVTYRDFVQLEKQALESPAARGYWKKALDGAALQPLPRWPKHLCRGGSEQVRGPEISISPEVVEGLKRLAHGAAVPLRTVLLAAHCRVMSLVTGQRDVVTGLVSNGRPQVAAGERLIGLFLNTLPFRLPMQGGTWRELVRATFARERELLPFRRSPLSEIQQLTGGQPLFESVFDFVQFHVYQDLPGYSEHSFLEDYYFEANNFTFYATFMLDASGSELQMHFDYDPNELCPDQIRALCDYYVQTLRAMAAAPEMAYESQCLLADEERTRLLHAWNQTQAEFPQHLCVPDLITAQAAQTPEKIALEFEGTRLTYAQLEAQANALARHLQKLGVGREDRAGLHLRRSPDMVVSLLAVLKAGGAYVPLDPSYPSERLAFMAEDAQLKAILTDGPVLFARRSPDVHMVFVKDVLAAAGGKAAAGPVEAASDAEQLAYVIYTSGSTGKPKGVQIEQRALVNFLTSMAREPGLQSSDRLLAVTTLSFDIAGLEVLLPLTVGATIILSPGSAAMDPRALARLLESEQVTVMQATPTTWRMLVESGWSGSPRMRALCGGESLSRDLADQLLERCAEVWNLYGPTETTIWSSIHKVQPGAGPVAIGGPIANTQIYVLDERHQLVPTATEGEICIGGAGLARGYLHRPDLTAEKFVLCSLDGREPVRVYRTGDRGKYLPDGTLLCLGRSDFQVKVRGFRIELEEIESVLLRHPKVRAAVVAADQDSALGTRLVAYYVVKPSASVSAFELRKLLEAQLPAHMVPSVMMELAELPLTPNGKVDRRRLPEPAAERAEKTREFVAPRTPLEEEVAALWKEILKIDHLGIHDNFFQLGGHSLLATRMTARLRNRFQIELSPAVLFQHTTVESLSLKLIESLLERERGGDGPMTQPVGAARGEAAVGVFQPN